MCRRRPGTIARRWSCTSAPTSRAVSIAILQEFAARRINLSNLFSRPTKDGGLGHYCFIMYADGHVADELVADTMRALHAKQGGVKFLGSYPAAGEAAATAREHAGGRWRDADDWLADIRGSITT